MWESKAFVFVTLLLTVQGNLMQNIASRLEMVYDYILKNHELMNIDAIFGVVLSQAFLSEVEEEQFGDPKRLERLRALGALSISKTITRLERTSNTNKMLIEFAFDSVKWERKVRFRSGLLLNQKPEMLPNREEFIRALAYTSFNESVSDKCMLELLKGPDPSTNACKISALCHKIMVDDPNFGAGYSTTHRVLYSQLSKISKCEDNGEDIKKYCSQLLLETQLIRRFGLVKELHDLLFEEVTVCGMEGFEEFMQHVVLKATELLQHDNGCYGFIDVSESDFKGTKMKRGANLIGGGCVDHTTGLGASVLSLFLKYYSQNPHRIVY